MSDFYTFLDRVRGLFLRAGFVVREITSEANRYTTDGIPWLIVVTDAGPISVGWRRQVMQLDWSYALRVAATVKDFSPREDVTKGEAFIHAHSYEKLAEYLGVLRANLRPRAEARKLRALRFAALVRKNEDIFRVFREESEAALRAQRMLSLDCDHPESIPAEDVDERVCTTCFGTTFIG